MYHILSRWALLIVLVTAQPANAVHWDVKNELLLSEMESVEEAVTAVTDTLTRQGFEIVAIINHAAAAASVGLELPPTQLVLFRQAKLDEKLIRRSQQIAIDLPLKLLIWEDDDGAIQHKFNGPGYLADRHKLPFVDWALSRLARTMRQFGEADNGIVSIASAGSVADTSAALEDIVTAAGFRVPVTIDFTQHTRRPLRDTFLIIFGNPNVGTQLMLNAREIGIDLPQKFLVWEDRSGQTWISYNDPQFIAKRAGVQGLDLLLGNIASALSNFANQGATP